MTKSKLKPTQRISILSNQISPHITQERVTTTKTKMVKKPITVCVTGAAGQIGYALLPIIASGRMLGDDQPIVLHLLEIPQAMNALNGVCMELEDSAYTLLKGVVPTSDYKTAFTGCQIAILVGAFPRRKGMERKDLLAKNISIFKGQGEAMNAHADKNIKVLVVGNPANTNALMTQHFAPNIPKENFTCLTRLDMNRAKAQIANRVGCEAADVSQVTIWGNHSATQYPDVSHALVKTDNKTVSVSSAVDDDNFLRGEFISSVQKRGKAIITARGLSSAASAAKAITDHIHDWVIGSADNDWVSMGVTTDGSYGIAKGLIYSMPVTCKNGSYKIVTGLKIDDFSNNLMKATEKELLEERETAMGLV